MANYVREVGTPTRVTASGVATLGAGNNLSLIGIGVAGVLTSQMIQLWQGSTTGSPILGTCTLAANSYFEVPALCSGGLTYCVTNEDVDLTIYWNPEPRT